MMIHQVQRFSLLILSILLFYGCGTTESASDSANSVARNGGRAAISSDSELKPFSEVIKSSFDKDEGLFTVYKDDDTFYYEIPDSLFAREMLTISRIAKTADGISYGGMKNNTQVLRWVKRDKKVLL